MCACAWVLTWSSAYTMHVLLRMLTFSPIPHSTPSPFLTPFVLWDPVAACHCREQITIKTKLEAAQKDLESKQKQLENAEGRLDLMLCTAVVWKRSGEGGLRLFLCSVLFDVALKTGCPNTCASAGLP